jgi:hypothetical protein
MTGGGSVLQVRGRVEGHVATNFDLYFPRQAATFLHPHQQAPHRRYCKNFALFQSPKRGLPFVSNVEKTG